MKNKILKYNLNQEITKDAKIKIIVLIIMVFFGGHLTLFKIPKVNHNLYLLEIGIPLFFAFSLKQIWKSKICKNTMQFFLILSLFGFLCSISATDKIAALKAACNFLLGCIVTITFVAQIDNRAKINFALKIILIHVVLFCALGLFESFFGKYLFSNELSEVKMISSANFYYPFAVFNNYNDFCTFLIILYPFLFYYLNNLKKPLLKIVVFSLSVLLIVLLSDAIISLFVFFVIILLFAYLKKRYYLVFLLLFLFLCGLIFTLVTDWDNIIRLITVRSQIWRNIFLNAKTKYFMGLGLKNSFIPIEGIKYIGILTNPHFFFLEILAELGVIPFIMIIYFLIQNVKKASRKIKSKIDCNKNIGISTFVSLITFVLISIQSSSLIYSYFLWVFLSLIIIFNRSKEEL